MATILRGRLRPNFKVKEPPAPYKPRPPHPENSERPPPPKRDTRMRPAKLLRTTLAEHGALTRAELWRAIEARPDRTLTSKRHMKRVLRGFVARGVIGAAIDTRRIREMKPKKPLTAKQRPPFLFRMAKTSRYERKQPAVVASTETTQQQQQQHAKKD